VHENLEVRVGGLACTKSQAWAAGMKGYHPDVTGMSHGSGTSTDGSEIRDTWLQYQSAALREGGEGREGKGKRKK